MPIGSFRLNTLAAALSAPAGPSYISATGGFQTFRFPIGSTVYRVHAFTSTGTLTVNSAPAGKTLTALLVAGGGGGGGVTTTTNAAGGGGAGGQVIDTGNVSVSAQGYNIVVGTGGTAGSTTTGTRGGNGLDTTAFGFTAQGGAGGANNTTGGGGVSNGGGGGTQTTTSNPGGTGNDRNGGNAFGSATSSARSGGGGAGAGGAGANGISNVGGNGGSAYPDSFNSWGRRFGVAWGGGGGGGGASPGGPTGNNGGTDVGGTGATNGNGGDAPGYGGGGGGARNTGSIGRTGGLGGPGLVLVRYEVASIREADSTFTANAGGTITPTATTGRFGNCLRYSNNNTSGFGSYNFGTSGVTFNRANNTAPMTMEYWFRHNVSDSQRNTMAMSTGNFGFNTFGTLELYYDSGNGTWRFRIGSTNYTATGISAGSWHHIAIYGDTSRQVSIWVNGNPIATNVAYSDEVTALRLGAGYGGSNTPIGNNNFDEVRFSYGARYTPGSSFTTPTAAFTNDNLTLGLFHCETTTQTDDTA